MAAARGAARPARRFGTGWLRGGALELFTESVRLLRAAAAAYVSDRPAAPGNASGRAAAG